MKTASKILLTISFFIHCPIKGQGTESSFKGKIKSVKEVAYHAIQQGDLLVKDTVLHTVFTLYNAEGLPTESKQYNSKGKILNNVVWNYNKNKQLMEIRITDSLSNQIEHWKFRYDSKGRAFDRISYSPVGKTKTIEAYNYDEKGNIVESNEYNTEDELLTKVTLTYDSSGREISKYEAHLYLGDAWQYETRYDDNNNSFEVLWADASGMLLSITTYTYTYDDKENWVRQIEVITEMSEPIKIRERVLAYYE